MKRIKENRLNLILFIILPVIINAVMESLGSRSFFGGVVKLISDPYIFLCNTLIVAATLSVGVFFKRFRLFWVSVISIIWLTLATANFVLISNRVLPLTAYDVQLIDALPFVIKKYLSPFSLAVMCLGIVAALLGIVIAFFRALESPKIKLQWKKATAYFVAVMLITCTNLQFAISSGILNTYFPELARDYIANGFAYSFSIGLVDRGVDEVDGYSEELIESITEKFVATDSKGVKKPNIIFVQMESFFDINELKGIKLSKNPIPNMTKLMAENPSGLLTVPVIGAGTANTEFEVITGMRTADFGAGEYPYRTILVDDTCESVATNLKNHGYTSHFMHNYRGTFYGRDNVYANLGYDKFYSIEYMTDYEVNPNGWPKDNVLIKYINECLDSTEGKDLINVVSVQGHGGYNITKDYERHITVKNCIKKPMKESYEYYVNQLYEMDKVVGEIVDSISQREEDTILVIFGDHLPSLEIENGDLKNRNIYQTDYFIWNNMGIEYADKDMKAYQLASRILESVNITDGVINSCHQNFKDDENYLFNLQALEYDTLYGEKYAYNGKKPYVASDMKINARKMQINSVTKKENTEKTYVIKGFGFSERCYVKLGYRIIKAEYINETTMEFDSRSMDADTPVSVWEKDVGETNECFMEK